MCNLALNNVETTSLKVNLAMFQNHTNKGFSLLELMVTVAIVGLLAMFAYPSYMDYLRRTGRAEAKAVLMENAQYLERYFTTNNTYVGASLPTAVSPKSSTGTSVRYNISFSVALSSSGFTMQAVPVNAQVRDSCGTLTLNQAGVTTPSTAGCW